MKNSVIQSLRRLGIAAVSLVVCTSSFAGKSVVTGTLEMATPLTAEIMVDGVAADSFTDGYPHYGDEVGFLVSLDGRVSAKSRTIVTVQCKQTTDQGWFVVYQSGSDTDYVFKLSDQDYDYLDWDGGAAQCHAELLYRESTGKNTATWILDTDDFAVTAAQ